LNLNITPDDLERLIEEATASGDLPDMPASPNEAVGAPDGSGDSAAPAAEEIGEAVASSVAAQTLTVQETGAAGAGPMEDTGRDEEIVSLLRDLLDVCKRGFSI
jgi:hypothetical protein